MCCGCVPVRGGKDIGMAHFEIDDFCVRETGPCARCEDEWSGGLHQGVADRLAGASIEPVVDATFRSVQNIC